MVLHLIVFLIFMVLHHYGVTIIYNITSCDAAKLYCITSNSVANTDGIKSDDNAYFFITHLIVMVTFIHLIVMITFMVYSNI